ncbi:MAG TPA: DMT family transporter [Myxococcaceae bacterium]|nr:DMT family transporter [Myxococcaceae bacterium]
MRSSLSDSRTFAEALLVFCCLLWALAFLWTKDSLADADPMTFLVLRFAVGAAVLAPIAGRSLGDRVALRGGLQLGSILFIGYALQTAGLVYTTPARSGFITGMCVVLVPIVSLLLFRRVPGIPALLGVVFAAGGLTLLTWPVGIADPGPAVGTLRGDLLTLAGAAVYAVHICLTELWAPRAKAVALVGNQLWVVALLALCSLPFVDVRFEPTTALWTGVLLSGALASSFAISVQTWAQVRTTAVRAAVIFALEPVFTAVLSSMMGREELGAREWLGGAMVVVGVLAAEVGGAFWARRQGAQSAVMNAE